MAYWNVASVEALPGYRLGLEFEDGKRGVFDMGPYLGRGMWAAISDPVSFAAARVDYGTVAWSDAVDMAPDVLYDGCEPLAGDVPNGETIASFREAREAATSGGPSYATAADLVAALEAGGAS